MITDPEIQIGQGQTVGFGLLFRQIIKLCFKFNQSNFTNDIDDVVPLGRKKQEAPTEMYAALCTLFEENQELTNDLFHSCIDISFTEEDVSIVTETCAEQCLDVCSATCDRDFTEIEYTAEELKGIQAQDPDL